MQKLEIIGTFFYSIYDNLGNYFVLSFLAFHFYTAYIWNYTVQDLSFWFLWNLQWGLPAITILFITRKFIYGFHIIKTYNEFLESNHKK